MNVIIDNYDSFTYNIYQYVGYFNSDVEVIKNDHITIEEIYDENTVYRLKRMD